MGHVLVIIGGAFLVIGGLVGLVLWLAAWAIRAEGKESNRRQDSLCDHMEDYYNDQNKS